MAHVQKQQDDDEPPKVFGSPAQEFREKRMERGREQRHNRERTEEKHGVETRRFEKVFFHGHYR
jgi:hypothetical protein